jgi:hypothetical protein
MYGPVATWCWPYVDGCCLSNFWAYSFGTGAEAGMLRQPATIAPRGRSSLNTIVWASGVVMPEMSLALPDWNALRPVRSPI